VVRILVLGGSGEMGSAAVRDLVDRTGHEVTVGDIRVDAAHALLDRLRAPDRVVEVDVDDPRSLASALADTDVVLNATYMRQNVQVTDAAIAAGVHLVDLGSYYPETLQQLERHAAAEQAGCRIVPGCGVAPGLTNILARLGADQLDAVDAIRMYSYITHPMWTSPGIVVTRFDASTGTSIVWEGGRAVEYPSFSGEERFAFPEPYGEQEVHLVPHPEPLTLPRTIDVRDVVFKVGYPADETERIRVLLELGFDSDEPHEFDGTAISPRRFAAAYIGGRGIGPTDRSANVKHVRVEGVKDGRSITLTYDFAVEQTGRSASAAITGTVAAIAADLVARGGPVGVHPPEAAFPPRSFIDALAERGLFVVEGAHAGRLYD
jgi:saccharopine dehydrogenase-like NADP-dependent oxidoreductase